MILSATRDVGLVNSFLNDPDILPFCGFPAGATYADCASRIGDDDLVFVTDGATAMMGLQSQPEGWEKHNLFRRACRGRAALVMGHAMFAWARDALGAAMILASTPIGNRAARWFNRQLGMESTGFSSCPIVGPVEDFRKDVACR